MRLVGMEIQGFKSFPDKTRLEFNDGLTAVVGPNGSGKSNIADALRWVLGEQSSRSLRGNRMEDVIFGGTQSKKPLASCSVTLFMDNKDRQLPYDEDEVAITRKYFRSGESEFRINKTAVRLMDIYEIFMDTGLGRDGYSIIGQGKIAEIVSAKSNERREIFEEAAGISKFRYRKREAERRLISAEENLLRLKDILLELSQRIEPLRRDSEKAERFLSLSGEKRTLEISIWSGQLTLLKERLKNLSDEVYLEEKRYEDAEQTSSALEKEVNALYEGMQQRVVQLDALQKEIVANQEVLLQSGSTKAVLENDILHNTKTLENIQQRLRESIESGQELEEREKALDEKLCELKKALSHILVQQNQNGEKRLELQQELSKLDQNGQQYRLRRGEVYRLLESKRGQLASGSAIVEETTAQLNSFEQTMANGQTNLKEIAAEYGEITGLIQELDRHLQQLVQETSLMKQQIYEMEEQKKHLLQQRQQLENQRNGYQQKAKMLEDMDKNMEGYAGSVRFIMNSAQKGLLQGIVAPVSHIMKIHKRFSVAIEVALGASMQNIITENEEAAKTAIRLLKTKNSGRATFLPLTTIKGQLIAPKELSGQDGYVGIAAELVTFEPRFQGIINSLLGRTIVAENLDKGVLLSKASGYRYRIVTLDGQLLHAGGSMTGGSMARSAGILGRSTQIEELKAATKGIDDQLVQLDHQIQLENRQLSALQSEYLALDEKMRGLEGEKIGYQAESKRIAQSLKQAELFSQDAELRYQEISKRLAVNQELSTKRNQEIFELEKELSTLEEEITAGNFHREQLLVDRGENDQLSTHLRTEGILLERDISAVEERVQELTAEGSNRKSQMAQLTQEQKRLTEENDTLQLRIENLSEEKIRLQKRITHANHEIIEKTTERNQLEQTLNQKRQLQRQTEMSRDQFYRGLIQGKSRLEGVENEEKSLLKQLWDGYELTPGQAMDEAKPLEDVSVAVRTLSEIRNRIKGLGHVNLGAIEEYREVLGRHEELSTQIKDVEDAKQALAQLIGELTSSMCVIFKEKFAAVDRCFQEIFVQLFGGGKASLSLTDPENVLESGIEIHVQPPGKVIKNLTLLSGGEQSFVAIAIYFAILRVNPSPFCLLDEIEAALDDVNVDKFARYLKELTATTQFLVITHRRGTMEEADRLYGVTMQEDGISKLLELRVEELSKNLGLKE